MSNLGVWDVIVLIMAAYFAVVTLVRLLWHRRDEVMTHYRRLVETERKRKKAALLRQRSHEMRRLGGTRSGTAQRPKTQQEERRAA